MSDPEGCAILFNVRIWASSNALVGQFDQARVTARETNLLEGHDNGNDQSGRQRHRNVLIRRLSQDRAGRASIQRPTRQDCGRR